MFIVRINLLYKFRRLKMVTLFLMIRKMLNSRLIFIIWIFIKVIQCIHIGLFLFILLLLISRIYQEI